MTADIPGFVQSIKIDTPNIQIHDCSHSWLYTVNKDRKHLTYKYTTVHIPGFIQSIKIDPPNTQIHDCSLSVLTV
jgi:hypothetical protein